MAPNTVPIYSSAPDVQWGSSVITTANTAKDGTGSPDVIFTADATNGGRIEKIRFRAAGTNVATVARVFINNGSTTETAANNILYEEITLPATTLSEVAALTNQEISLNLALPAGYRITVTIGTTVSAGYYVSAIGSKY